MENRLLIWISYKLWTVSGVIDSWADAIYDSMRGSDGCVIDYIGEQRGTYETPQDISETTEA